LSERPDMNLENGPALVGFKPLNRDETLTAGAHFLAIGAEPKVENDEGYMTSVAYSPSLGHSIGLGFLDNGANRIGERLRAVDFVRGKDIRVEVASPHFIDPEGERLRA